MEDLTKYTHLLCGHKQLNQLNINVQRLKLMQKKKSKNKFFLLILPTIDLLNNSFLVTLNLLSTNQHYIVIFPVTINPTLQ